MILTLDFSYAEVNVKSGDLSAGEPRPPPNLPVRLSFDKLTARVLSLSKATSKPAGEELMFRLPRDGSLPVWGARLEGNRHWARVG